jgi:hypothetical protein
MKRFILISLLASLDVAGVSAQSPKYPPLSEYMMTSEAEVALARSAAPENVSAHAHCQDTYRLRIQGRRPG